MADSIVFDSSELGTLAADLTAAGPLVEREVRPVVSRGALDIKRQQVSEMRASRHFKGVAPSISYDLSAPGAGIVEAQIGPDKARPGGALANIAYFGSSRGGGTVPDPRGALEAEAPNVEKYLAELADKALRL